MTTKDWKWNRRRCAGGAEQKHEPDDVRAGGTEVFTGYGQCWADRHQEQSDKDVFTAMRIARQILSFMFVFTVAVAGCKRKVPPPWSQLNLPTSGLKEIDRDTDEHGYYAEYTGSDREGLLADVSQRLQRAGYKPACTAVEGTVLGFSRGGHNIALKVDAVPELWLSIFDEKSGKDHLLHGVCFGRYQLGERTVVKEGATSPPSPQDAGR